jgi:hypothetical protein
MISLSWKALSAEGLSSTQVVPMIRDGEEVDRCLHSQMFRASAGRSHISFNTAAFGGARSALSANRANPPDKDAYVLLPEFIAKEPHGPVARFGACEIARR